MSISPRFLEELRSRLTLSDIIGRKVRLSRAGREFKACCPFHNEKTPSFYVNDDKQFYHCFGCGAHGSVIDFVMGHDNLSFVEAVEILATEAGMQVPKSSPQEVEKAKKEKSLYSLMEEATRWMEAQLRDPANAEAYRYITERGVSEEQLSAYRIGYAPADRQALRQHLKSLDFTDQQMIEAGVLRPPGKSGEPYAFFRERIMFPVPDRRGRIVAYGGRILPDHLRPPDQGDYKPAKYMNSSDTPLFHKGKMLYGEPHARQAAASDEPIIVVEGYLDVMACAKAGYRGAVAPLGTALTEDQLLVLWKMIPAQEKVPVLCFDGDNAGRRAAARACERILPLLKPDQSAKFAFLPEEQDPDSLVNAQGPKALQSIIDSAMSLVDFLWLEHTQGRDFKTPESRAGLSKTLEDEVLRIPDRDVQYYYRQAFRNKIYEAFQGRNSRRSYGSYANKANNALAATALKKPAYSRRRLAERALIAAMINHPGLFDYFEEDLGAHTCEEKRLDQLRQSVLSTLSHNPAVDRDALQSYLSQQGFESDLKGLLSESLYTHAGFVRPEKSFEDVYEGWKIAWQTLGKDGALRELKAAALAYTGELSEENESRVRALHDLHKNSD